MTQDPLVLIGGTFVAVLAIVVGLYWLLIARTETATRKALRQRIGEEAGLVRGGGLGVSKEVELLSSIGPLNALLVEGGFITRPLQRAIDGSGLHLSIGRFVLGSAGLAMLVVVLVLQFTGLPAAGVVLGLLALFLPFVALRIFTNRRLQKFEEQFPEAIDLIARSLRAGHALPVSLRLATEELPEPLSAEFKTLYEQQNYGLPLTDALRAFAARIPLIDARFFVTAVLTQREAGGNLAEVLDSLSEVIRERFKIRRQLRVQAAHGRLTGWVLGGLPPAVALVMAFEEPDQLKLLFASTTGVRMVVAAIVLQLVGVLLIRKITDVEY